MLAAERFVPQCTRQDNCTEDRLQHGGKVHDDILYVCCTRPDIDNRFYEEIKLKKHICEATFLENLLVRFSLFKRIGVHLVKKLKFSWTNICK